VIRDRAYTEEHEERERKAREEGRLPIFPLSPEMFRERTPEEKEKLRHAEEHGSAERYRGVYTSLGPGVTAYKDGTLDLTWRAGKGVSEVCASPRCTSSVANGMTLRVLLHPDGPPDYFSPTPLRDPRGGEA
jgi:hypothetical protein